MTNGFGTRSCQGADFGVGQQVLETSKRCVSRHKISVVWTKKNYNTHCICIHIYKYMVIYVVIWSYSSCGLPQLLIIDIAAVIVGVCKKGLQIVTSHSTITYQWITAGHRQIWLWLWLSVGLVIVGTVQMGRKLFSSLRIWWSVVRVSWAKHTSQNFHVLNREAVDFNRYLCMMFWYHGHVLHCKLRIFWVPGTTIN